MTYPIEKIKAAQSCEHRLHMPPSFGVQSYVIAGVRAHEVHIAPAEHPNDSFLIRNQSLADAIMSMQYAVLDVAV